MVPRLPGTPRLGGVWVFATPPSSATEAAEAGWCNPQPHCHLALPSTPSAALREPVRVTLAAMNHQLRLALARFAGVASAAELRAAGLTRGQVTAALRAGRLVAVSRGVYLAADADPTDLTVRRRLALAVGGPDAALSHGSAAAVWGVKRESGSGPIHVTVPATAPQRRVAGVHVHRSTRHDVTTRDRWPISSVPQMLRELALTGTEDDLRYPALAAIQRGLISPESLTDRTGVPRRALARWRMIAEEAKAGAVSGGEAHYWRLVRASGLPLPVLNAPVPGLRYRADALWPQYRLIVEIDGWETHGGRAAFDSDRRRQNDLQLAGYLVLRFPVTEVTSFPERVLLTTEDGLRTRARELGQPQP